MARILLIAYTTYVHDGRVKRHAEALAERGDHVDVICLDSGHNGVRDGVNVIGLHMPRYRGSRSNYMRSYLRFFVKASCARVAAHPETNGKSYKNIQLRIVNLNVTR